MGCIRKRRGKWVVDYRDAAGIRRWATCDRKRDAEGVLAERVRESRQSLRPAVDPGITLMDYSKRWLEMVKAGIKPSTLQSYELQLRRHINPVLGAFKVRQLVKGRIKAFLAEKASSGLSRNSVRIIHASLRAMLNAAIDDGVLLSNPADRLGRHLRLTTSAKDREVEIKAFDRGQVQEFLASAAEVAPRYHPLFFTLARTGLRLGEAFGLQWADLDFKKREILVQRTYSKGEIGTTKGRRSRTVDMSQELRRVLRGLEVARKTEKLERGWGDLPPWVFCTEEGTLLDQSRVSKEFKRTLKKAGLSLHFSPHALRHTFASLLLQQGESPAYVQRQLGHASIQLTVDTYGRWLPMGNKAAVDKLDASPEGSGSKVVANPASGTSPAHLSH